MQAKSCLPKFITKSVTAKDLLAIGSLWLIGLCIINPIGDFPLNDDWSFGLTVKRLLESGDFRPTGWTQMTLVTQTLWGTLFCLPAGFSFNALRLSTLVMSICGIFGTYFLTRQMSQSRLLAWAAALTLAFNPIYCVLSNTFMTDVHFAALEVWAVVFLVKNLRGGSDVDLAIGLTLAVAATLCRELGLCVPIAFALSHFFSRGPTRRQVIRAIIPLVACVGALFVFTKWLSATGRLPGFHNQKAGIMLDVLSDPERLALYFFRDGRNVMLYLGWFSLPFVVLAFLRTDEGPAGRRHFRIAGSAGLVFALASAISLLISKSPMPLSGNVLMEEGMGPLTLHDTAVLGLPDVPALGTWFWFIVTALSVIGGGLVVAVVVAVVQSFMRTPKLTKSTDDQATRLFLLLCTAAYLFPLLWSGFMDRYLMPVLPFLWAGVAPVAADLGWSRLRTRIMIGAVPLGLLSLFAVLGTKDYLAWNRARWRALNDLLVSQEVTPEDVDGGFEFNGWHFYDPKYQAEPGKSGWWVRRDSYLLAFGELQNRQVVKEYRFKHWLPPYTGRIVVLKKEAPQTSDVETSTSVKNPLPAGANGPRP